VRQTEIDQDRAVSTSKNDVRWFQVAMNDTLLVDCIQRSMAAG
jgi:hypothetical protein